MKTKGRPKGSEKDDSKALNAMADMIHANPKLKPTPAIRRHNPKAGEAEIRRLQVKWKERKETLLAAAQARAEAKQRQATSSHVPHARRSLSAAAEAARKAQEMYNSPTLRAMREFQNSPAARAIEALNSPAMRIMREIHDSPTMKAAREIAEAREKLNRMLGGW